MKLSLIFPLFVLLALVQNMDARPYPQESSFWSRLWPTSISSTVGGYLSSNDISQESTDLLSQGTQLAHQVLDVVKLCAWITTCIFIWKSGPEGGRLCWRNCKASCQLVPKRREKRSGKELRSRLLFPKYCQSNQFRYKNCA
uniref:Putative salivary secreted protein n=1 Tax=Panstrongylus lignarius TaxID=156445 RepID=A0A224XVZ5_9HEMI